ncbi:ricin-type beta-trefoil lectin domain protein [Streptomyces sp. NPDC046988]|uniref:ricin-type beta-trefoil lectin domain protein n=1 Tax=Streptomyces sp. NPDC046988 TaxID=3154922 RepID=UPI0033D079E9
MADVGHRLPHQPRHLDGLGPDPPQGPTGRITGQGGKCVGLAAGPVAGVQAVLDTCGDEASQQWTLGTDKTLWNQGKCLTTAQGGTANGTDVVGGTCSRRALQRAPAPCRNVSTTTSAACPGER